MLVLTRKSNQSIMIGDDIEVSVLSVMGEKVRIGIQAPQESPVFRKEIYLEIHREAAAAAALEGVLLVALDDLAPRRALFGGASQRLAAVAVERDLFDERPLPLGQALAHSHRALTPA